MSIVVEKSPNVQFNETSQKTLNSILATLEKQAEHVKSVHVLANFSVDSDATLQFGGKPIAQGLVVCLDKQYKFSKEDSSWFHPSIARGRSVFSLKSPISKTEFEKVELSGVNCSVGEFTVSKPDEFGCEQVEHRIVVDTSSEDMLLPLYNKWLQNNVSAGDIDKQWKRMKFGETYSITSKTELERANIAKKIEPNCQLIMKDTINAVISDTEHVYFTNSAVHVKSKDLLIKSSALGGYRSYSVLESGKRFYPSSLGTSDTFYSWDSMSPQNCSRIEHSCMWSVNLTFNTQVMKPPSISMKSIRAMEDEYAITHQDTLAMRMSTFSGSDNFVDKISPEDIYRLHPNTTHVSRATSYISAPISMQHPVMNKLMNNIEDIIAKFPNFQLFNPKYVTNGRFKIPREVYKDIA